MEKEAKRLLEDLYHTPEEHRIDLLKEALLKAAKEGYLDGLENGWWRLRENENFMDK